MELRVITFSGFDMDKQLREIGDINFWVDSRGYNIIEITGQVWLLASVDNIIGSIEC